MAGNGSSSTNSSRQSLEAEKKLLGFYDRLEDNSDSDWAGEAIPHRSRKLIPTPSDVRAWIFLVITVAITFTLGSALGYFAGPRCTELQCIKVTSSYSPLLEAVELYDYQFEAELGTENGYKGYPRPELDALWTRAGMIHPISMPEKYREVLNKTHSGLLYPEEQGGGVMVEIEVFHQVHCLNFLRKVIYADYYSRPENMPIEFEVGDDLFFNHIDHCIDYLRQFIMCTGDVTPVTSNWVMTHHSPHPDFNTMHKCRKFDKLLEWAEEHDQGGVPRQTPNPSWWPAPKLADTIQDVEPNFPVPPHGPPIDDSDRWVKEHPHHPPS